MSTARGPEVPARRLGYALKMAQHALRIRMDEVLRSVALTTPQYAVLSAVEAEPGMSNARLARAAFVSAQTMQAVLANLERDGLLQRVPDPDHGRILRSEMTLEGRRTLARAHVSVRVVEDQLVASFGSASVPRLTASLAKCAEDLRAGGRKVGRKT